MPKTSVADWSTTADSNTDINSINIGPGAMAVGNTDNVVRELMAQIKTKFNGVDSDVIPVARGGTGQTSYTDGQLLIGNSTGNTLTKATLTAGAGIAITNGSGAITIAATGGAVQANNGISLGTNSAGTAGNNNTSYGNSAGTAVVVGGDDLTLVGYQAGAAITTGDRITVIGSGALRAVTTGYDLVAIGYNAAALAATTSFSSVVIGASAASATTGEITNSTIIGRGVCAAHTAAINSNVFIGQGTAKTATSSGGGNVGIGQEPLGLSTTIGTENIAIGTSALRYAAGNYNVAIGRNTGGGNGSHSYGTFVGNEAGLAVTTGGYNTLIGANSGNAITTGANNTILGSYTGSAALASNVALSDGAGTRRFWHDATDAYVSHNTTASAANAYLDSATSKLQRSTSSLRYKRDVEDLWSAEADKLLKLKPVFYRSKCDADPAEFSYYGVIAEQAHELGLQRLVQYEYAPEDYGEPDDNNERWPKPGAVKVPGGFAYDRMTVLLLDLVQRQQATITSLISRVEALEV